MKIRMSSVLIAARTALLILLIALPILLTRAATQIDINGPAGSVSFGSAVTVLPNGNLVITDPKYNFDRGAVYLYDGKTGTLISTLTGNLASDRVGSEGIVVLANGNFIVKSAGWHGSVGAVTFGDATIGVSGMVSSSNSLIGTNRNDSIGLALITPLSNGNYVVSSPFWNSSRGAVTLASGTTGISGEIASSNSLVGTVGGERVGTINGYVTSVTPLPNGNFVIISSSWNNNRGAVTLCNNTAGLTGAISASNSLVGSQALDSVANGGITILTNGNYVVRSYSWNSGAVPHVGAVTFVDASVGVVGEVSASNSLVGTKPNEQIGNNGNGVTSLTNGNYVVLNTSGNGSATLGNGLTGVRGPISSINSLVGSRATDFYLSNVTALSNGNYVISTPNSAGGRGAVTWVNGVTGLKGEISVSNSLIGAGIYGLRSVTALANGNYVVRTPSWEGRGAVTFVDGTVGLSGSISASNSLVGSKSGDTIGSGVTALTNGNYVVSSPSWNETRGAVTLCNGVIGTTGEVSAANSLIGSNTADHIGANSNGDSSIVALPNGNFVVNSGKWNGNRGAVTWVDGIKGISDTVSAANSLIGDNVNDYVGTGITVLPNGNYVVLSANWRGTYGAVTFGNGTVGINGVLSSANSLVGSYPNDRVGVGNNLRGPTVLSNGNYVVNSPNWNGDRGAVTWASGATGVSGEINALNSLIGTTPIDLVGSGSLNTLGVIALSNNNYAVLSPSWNNGSVVNAGAVTFGLSTTPAIGEITPSNSVQGTSADGGSSIVYAEDTINRQFVVGRAASNIVTLLKLEAPTVKSRKRVRFF